MKSKKKPRPRSKRNKDKRNFRDIYATKIESEPYATGIVAL